jgi:hypothetical protein
MSQCVRTKFSSKGLIVGNNIPPPPPGPITFHPGPIESFGNDREVSRDFFNSWQSLLLLPDRIGNKAINTANLLFIYRGNFLK